MLEQYLDKNVFATLGLCICHGRNFNLVEFEILPVESPTGVSTGRNSNWNFYQG